LGYEFGAYDLPLPVFPAVSITTKSFTTLYQHLAPRYPPLCLYTVLLVTDPAVAGIIGPNWKHNDVSGFGAITTGVKEKRVRVIWPGYSQ
jgi:hypothetical protein